jgi:CO/xanthine dehydrogenase FAD-binding subunit
VCVEESTKERVLQVPAPFGYERATSVEHALALLEELGPEARLLAGGHSLLPMMKLRLATPAHLVDLDPLAEALGYVRVDDVTEIRVPVRRNGGSAYEKVGRRVADWAVVAAGAAVELEDGHIARAGIALAAAGGDITSSDAERALEGEAPSDELFARAGALAAAGCSPVSDQRGSQEYKRHVVGVLTERALRRATERAEGVVGCQP